MSHPIILSLTGATENDRCDTNPIRRCVMKLRTKEEARLYKQEYRKRLREQGRPVGNAQRSGLSQPKLGIDEIRGLRSDAIPLSAVGWFIYFLFSGEQIVYVGQTRSLLPRVQVHKNGTIDSEKKDFDSIALVPSTKETINREELGYIKWFSPKYNRAGKTQAGSPPCPTSEEYELKLKILRAKVLMLESELREARKLIPPKPDSPYRGF
jgi:hypothetical protein